ncbi:MAG TPA: F0F1 ATP synthase subunit B [Candidatus Omnitrophota bacterium]|nr:F0F1 ATP synthase subunit B [Candidatus Omnitrophota bacterium]
MDFFQTNINLGEVFVQLLAFAIVFWVLRALAWKPILKALETRRELIKNEFNKIESAKKENESLHLEYANRLQKIEEEARGKLQQAIDEGKEIARELQESARKEARAVLEKAKEDIALEVAKAKVTLRHEIADLTLGATEKLIREKLDDTKDKELVLDFIEELEKLK